MKLAPLRGCVFGSVRTRVPTGPLPTWGPSSEKAARRKLPTDSDPLSQCHLCIHEPVFQGAPRRCSLVNMVRSIRCRGCQGDRPLASLQPGKPEDAVGVPPVDDPYPPTSREGGVRPFGSLGPGGRGPRARRVRCSARCGPARRVVQQPKARKEKRLSDGALTRSAVDSRSVLPFYLH